MTKKSTILDNKIVQYVLSKKYRRKSEDGNEYICLTCSSELMSGKLPAKCAYNREKVSILSGRKENIMKQNINRNASERFLRSCKELPEYVCTCCHRMLFRKTVHVLQREKYNYTGVCHTVFSDRFRYKDADKEEEYICRTCSKDLKQNRMPAQAVANGLEVSNVPAELQGLTRLEVRCIGLRVPFMMITALPKGKRGKIRGACVNVPASLEPIAEVLPRVPENMDMVILKFKRIVVSKNNYMCDYIRPYKVMTALRWLKTNNPHYVNVQIDENWLQKFAEDDSFESVIESSQVDITIGEPPKEVELGHEDLDMSDTKSNRKDG